MGNMYTLDAFNTSNPADQDILSHYKMQQVIAMKTKNNMINWSLIMTLYRTGMDHDIIFPSLGKLMLNVFVVRAPKCRGERNWKPRPTPTRSLDPASTIT